MKRAGLLVLAFAALVLSTGCPFESTVPLGSPGPGSLDPQLKGRWVAGTLYHKFIEIDCLPFNANEYYVELRLEGKEPERYRAYTARVGGEATDSAPTFASHSAKRGPRGLCVGSTSISALAEVNLVCAADQLTVP